MKETAGTKGKVVLHNNFTELSNKLYKQFKESFCRKFHSLPFENPFIEATSGPVLVTTYFCPLHFKPHSKVVNLTRSHFNVFFFFKQLLTSF